MKNLIYKRIKLLSLIIFIFSSASAQNKIIYFISPPRSLSVAFLRMMQARGDFLIMHEPSQYAFNALNSPGSVNDWFNENAYKTFEEVKEKIFEHAECSNVFVKEMSFAVYKFLLNDPAFVKDSRITFVLLVRNPHHALLSLYKKLKHNFSEIFDSEDTCYSFADLVGYKCLYQTLCLIKEYSSQAPIVLLTEDLYNNPEKTVQSFCDQCNISFKEDALLWQDLGDTFLGTEEWHELKKSDRTHYWHSNAIRSTGFSQPSHYEVDSLGEPTFSEVENLEHRTICIEAYKENLNYYNLMLHTLEQ